MRGLKLKYKRQRFRFLSKYFIEATEQRTTVQCTVQFRFYNVPIALSGSILTYIHGLTEELSKNNKRK